MEIAQTTPITERAAPLPRVRLLSPTLLLFLLAMILANMGGNMYGPLLPLYLKELKAGVVEVGLFFTLSSIIPLLLQILGGWISDSFGRLRAIAFGSVAGVFVYVALILAPTWQWVLLATSFGAICGSLIGPSFDAFIAENSSEHNRARVFGLVQTLFMIVSVVGPPLGGWMVDNFGYRWMLLVAAAMYLVATALRIYMARNARKNGETHTEKLSLASLRANLGTMAGLVLSGGVITWILITDGVRDTFYNMSFNLMPLYLEDIGSMSVQQIGWLNAIFGVSMMALTIPAGWLADKKGERVGIALGFVLHFAALITFLQAASFAAFALSWALMGVGAGLMAPAYQSLISKAVPEKIRGTAFGLFNTSLGILSLPAPAVGAQLWERVSPRFPFSLTAWAALLSVIPIWLKFKLPKTAVATNEEKSL